MLLNEKTTLSTDLDKILHKFSFAASKLFHIALDKSIVWYNEKSLCSSKNDLKFSISINLLVSVSNLYLIMHILCKPVQSYYLFKTLLIWWIKYIDLRLALLRHVLVLVKMYSTISWTYYYLNWGKYKFNFVASL